jgi:hypothetical protein
MDYNDAVTEVLDKAARIRLPGHRLDVVTIARREFANADTAILNSLIPSRRHFESALRWSMIQKRQIWESTETGLQSDVRVDSYTMDSIDMGGRTDVSSHRVSFTRFRRWPDRSRRR